MSTDPRFDLFSLAPVATTLDNGKRIHLRRITAAERLAWFERVAETAAAETPAADAATEVDKSLFRDSLNDQAFVLAIGLCDERGVRLFADNELDRIPQIVDAQETDRLFREILKLNGLGGEEAKDDLKKKSPPAGDGSNS